MNNLRRKEINALISDLEELQARLEIVRDEETEYRDNMPENLQGSEKFEQADQYCTELDEACDNISSTIDNLNNVL
jgi:uncharacterized membrane protein